MLLRNSFFLGTKTQGWQNAGEKKRLSIVAGKWICTVFCVLNLFAYAAHAAQPSITGLLVNGVAASGGPVGATLTIQGSGFGNTQGFSTATLNGVAIAGNGVRPNSWSNTSIVTVIPTNATTGPVVVKVGGKSSNSVNFTVAPVINSLSPPSGDLGTSVTITGNNFASQTGNAVTFNGVSSTPSSWSSTRIVAPVPWTTSGRVVVSVGAVQSNGVNFAIAAPVPGGSPATGTFFVNRTDDPPVPVDSTGAPLLAQFCQNTSETDTSSPCSLREAIVEANGDANDSASSPDTIMLGAGVFHLNIPSTGSIDGTTGHLDITNPVTIVGTGATTTIQADPALNDQIFIIDAQEEGSIGFPVAISNLVIQGGHANPNNIGVTSGGAFLWEAGSNGTGQLRLTNVTITGNTAMDPGDPGVDDGGGMALFNTAGVTTPAQVNITGSAITNNVARVVAHGGIDSRAWSKAEVAAMRNALQRRQPNPFARRQTGPAQDGWKIVETLPAVSSPHISGNLLLSSRISGQGTDDVLVIDGDAGKIAVASHPKMARADSSFRPARLATRSYSAGTPLAAISFPVNVDAREGLVVLHRGQTMPTVIMPISARALASQPPPEAK